MTKPDNNYIMVPSPVECCPAVLTNNYFNDLMGRVVINKNIQLTVIWKFSALFVFQCSTSYRRFVGQSKKNEINNGEKKQITWNLQHLPSAIIRDQFTAKLGLEFP